MAQKSPILKKIDAYFGRKDKKELLKLVIASIIGAGVYSGYMLNQRLFDSISYVSSEIDKQKIALRAKENEYLRYTLNGGVDQNLKKMFFLKRMKLEEEYEQYAKALEYYQEAIRKRKKLLSDPQKVVDFSKELIDDAKKKKVTIRSIEKLPYNPSGFYGSYGRFKLSLSGNYGDILRYVNEFEAKNDKLVFVEESKVDKKDNYGNVDANLTISLWGVML